MPDKISARAQQYKDYLTKRKALLAERKNYLQATNSYDALMASYYAVKSGSITPEAGASMNKAYFEQQELEEMLFEEKYENLRKEYKEFSGWPK